MFHNVDVDIDCSKTAADIGFKVWGKSPSTDISTYHKPTDFVSSCQRTETEFKSSYSEKKDSVEQVPQVDSDLSDLGDLPSEAIVR